MSQKHLSGEIPVPPSERIFLLDAVRGFALFGVLLANLSSFSFPEAVGAQRVISTVGDILISTKFLTLFSILFGAGFYYQWERLRKKGDFRKFFLKRMFWLFVIGSIHAHFLWFGDILRIYALCGMLMLFFPLQNSKAILVWAIILMVPLTAIAFIGQSLTPYLTQDYPDGEAIKQAFTQGSYIDVMAINWAIDPIRHFYKDSILTLTTTLGKVLFGAWLAHKGFFSHPLANPKMLKNWILAGLFFGLPCSIAYWALSNGHLEIDSPALLWIPFVVAGGLVLHSLLYLSFFVYWYERAVRSKLSQLLEHTGRMSLTNYLSQTLVGILVFYGIGLGLGGAMSPSALYVFGTIFFIVQMLFSDWWVRHVGTGPVEGLWRRLTYPRRKSLLTRSSQF